MRKTLPHRSFMFSVLVSGTLASLGLLGGLGVNAVKEQLIAFVPLFIAMPAMNAMAGDYAMLVTAHIGDPETQRQTVKKLLIALSISLPISIVGITAVSLFIAILRGFEITRQTMFDYSLFIAVSLTSVVLITIISIFIINSLVKKRTYNSDDILIPVANTLASILMLFSFAVIALILR